MPTKPCSTAPVSRTGANWLGAEFALGKHHRSAPDAIRLVGAAAALLSDPSGCHGSHQVGAHAARASGLGPTSWQSIIPDNRNAFVTFCQARQRPGLFSTAETLRSSIKKGQRHPSVMLPLCLDLVPILPHRTV